MGKDAEKLKGGSPYKGKEGNFRAHVRVKKKGGGNEKVSSLGGKRIRENGGKREEKKGEGRRSATHKEGKGGGERRGEKKGGKRLRPKKGDIAKSEKRGGKASASTCRKEEELEEKIVAVRERGGKFYVRRKKGRTEGKRA